MWPTFAQVGLPQATPDGLITTVVCLLAIIAGATMVLKFMNELKVWRAKPAVDRDGEMVTRSELEKVERELSSQFARHESYTRDRLHELGNSVHTLTNKFAAQPMETRVMIDLAIKPIQEKVDSMSITVAAIGAKMGIPPPTKQ